MTAAKFDARHRAAGVFAKPARPRDYLILDGAKSATVPYEDGGRGRIYVSVLIDDEGPFPFEVDTGAYLTLTPETAAKIHLVPVGNIANSGQGPGIDHSGLVRTREIRIGSAIIQNQIVSSINSQPVSQLSPSDALVIFGGPIGSNVDLQVTSKDGGDARSVQLQLKELLP